MIKNIVEAICKFLNGHRCLGVFVLLALNYYQIKKIAASLNLASCQSKPVAEKQYKESLSAIETTTMPGEVFNTTSTTLQSKFCLDEDIQYQGKLNISFNHLPLSFEEIAKRESPDETGLFEPKTCTPPKNSRVAIIIPFRDETKALIRTRHLQYLLEHMIPGILFLRLSSLQIF